MMEWQPIETAPKNGTLVVVCALGSVPVSAVYVSWAKNDSGGWLAVGNGEMIEATHWIPLPPPPQKT